MARLSGTCDDLAAVLRPLAAAGVHEVVLDAPEPGTEGAVLAAAR